MIKNIFIYGIIAMSLVASIVYLSTTRIKKKSALPYFGVDSITAGSDTIWHKVGDFDFINQEGKHITQTTLNQKIYICDFFFIRCPGICKDMAVQLRRVYKAYKDVPDVVIISHTVDPESDSVPALRSYARLQGIAITDKWHMLTGNKKQIYDMARIGYYATATQGDGGKDDFVHTERFILVDKNKHIRGLYDGTNENEVNKMMYDIDRLREEQ